MSYPGRESPASGPDTGADELRRRLAALTPQQRAELVDRLGGARSEPVLVARPRVGPVPASYAQRTLWFLDRLTPGHASYHTGVTYRLDGALDVAALRRAFAAVVRRHESLRTEFADGPDGPVQRILPEVPVDLPVTDVDGADPAGREEQARQLAVAETRRPFDLGTGPLWRARLLRLAPRRHLLVLVAHHIVVDGWSFDVFGADLSTFYRIESGEAVDAPAPLPLQYADYSLWQHEWLSGRTYEQLVTYWRDQLAGAATTEFPTDRPRPARMTHRGARREVVLPRDLVDLVGGLVRAERTSPFTVYLAAFLVLLHRYTGLTDTVVGAPAANRSRLEVEQLIGFFANMLPLRTDLSGNPTVPQLLRRVGETVRGAFAHGDLPFERLVDAVRPTRDPARSPLFQIGFTAQEWAPPPQLPELTVEQEYVDAGTSRFDMSWWVTARPDGLHVGVEYNGDLYDGATVDQLIGHYDNLLRGLLTQPSARIGDLPLLTDAQLRELLAHGTGPRLPVPRLSVPQAFAAQVRRTPGAVALVTGDREYTYADLAHRVRQLVPVLRAGGAGTGRRVAICLRRDVDLIVAVLAVLTSGAAYVPVDPGNPPARIADILDDAAPVCVLTHGELSGRLPAGTPGVLVLDEPRLDPTGPDRGTTEPGYGNADPDSATDGPDSPDSGPDGTHGPDGPDGIHGPDGPDEPGPQPHDAAYVMYTSGTTGRPKGVVVEHHSVIGFVTAMAELFRLTPADRILGYASPTFDVFVGEVFMALLTGGRLCLAADADRLDMDRLQRLLETTRVTVTDLPPAVMALLRPERLPDLRIVFVGGEAFPGELVNRWNPGRRFFNGYGPTECTVTMVVHECPGHWTSSPPIGRPVANHLAHVVDAGLRPVPYGVAGELVIGGTGLAREYLNDPELTRAKFVADPFGCTDRLYRTGDLVRRERDGSIVFLGRIDQQVKIRGIRIELGEIEAALATHPRVEQVAVLAWTDPHGQRQLVGYVGVGFGENAGEGVGGNAGDSAGAATAGGSGSGGDGADGPVTVAALRGHLADRLPRTMIPSYWVILDALPLTVAGKVDHRALPAPDTAAPAVTATGVPPRTGTEQALAAIVTGVVGRRSVGVTDDFFELGGNSLQAAQVMSRVTTEFGVEVGLADFLRVPTVAQLATVVDRLRAEALDDVDADLLDEIAQMSDEEAARLLELESRS